MKIRFRSFHFWIRVISVACLLIPLSLTGLRAGRPPALDCLIFSLLAACSVLIMLPIADENIVYSLFFALLVLADSVCFALTDFPRPLFVFVCLLLILAHQLLRLAMRHSVLRVLFKPQSVWYSIESHFRLLLSLGGSMLALLAVALPPRPVAGCLLAVLLLLLYALLFYRSLSGRCLILSRSREKAVKRMIGRMLDNSAQSLEGEDGEEMVKIRYLYDKITRIMLLKRPFLDPDYSLQDLADSTYTNKTYVSKAINVISGKNFCQFVNGYRIQHAVDLLEDSPRLRVGQLAEKCGFRSSVTFNMAFKLNMGETPGEYTLRLRSALVSPLSSSRELQRRRAQGPCVQDA